MAGELVSSLVHDLHNQFLHKPERVRRRIADWAVVFGHAAEAVGQGVKLRAEDRMPDGRSYIEVVRSVHQETHERFGKGAGRDEGAALEHLAEILGQGLDADPQSVVKGAAFPGETLGDIALDWVAACRTPHFKTVRDLPLLMQTLAKASLDGTGVLDPSERLEDGRRIRRIALELGQDAVHGQPFEDVEREVILALAKLWRGQTAAPMARLDTPCQGGSTVGAHLDAWRDAHVSGGPRL